MQGGILIVELSRQEEICDGDRQRIEHDLKKELGYLHGPPALSQGRVAMKDLLKDFDVRQSYQISSGDAIQNGETGSFQRMWGANRIHRDVGVNKMGTVTQPRTQASTRAPFAPTRSLGG